MICRTGTHFVNSGENMRKAILVCAALFASLSVAAQPVRAADYNGQLLDGRVFTAIVYTAQGGEMGIVTFVRDEARVFLWSGETVIVNLYDSEIMNPHFIGGRTLDGHFYRVDIDDASFLYSTEIQPIIGNTCMGSMCMPGPDGLNHNAFPSGMNDGMFFGPAWGRGFLPGGSIR